MLGKEFNLIFVKNKCFSLKSKMSAWTAGLGRLCSTPSRLCAVVCAWSLFSLKNWNCGINFLYKIRFIWKIFTCPPIIHLEVRCKFCLKGSHMYVYKSKRVELECTFSVFANKLQTLISQKEARPLIWQIELRRANHSSWLNFHDYQNDWSKLLKVSSAEIESKALIDTMDPGFSRWGSTFHLRLHQCKQMKPNFCFISASQWRNLTRPKKLHMIRKLQVHEDSWSLKLRVCISSVSQRLVSEFGLGKNSSFQETAGLSCGCTHIFSWF